MTIGSLGTIPFYVSVDESILLNNINWETSARYAEHTRHNNTDMLEYVGDDPDKITFDIKLSAFLGVNPTKMLEHLTSIFKNHEAVKLVLGTVPIPGYWVVTNIERQIEYLHQDGTLLSADVNVTLREYVIDIQVPVISNRLSFINRMDSIIVPIPSSGEGRSPVIPAAAANGSVSISSRPTTKPSGRGRKKDTLSDAAIIGRGIGAAYVAGVKIINAVSSIEKKYNVTGVLKNAFSNRNYNATKTAPAKPVVVRKNNGVNPNSSKHSRWIHTVK